MTWIGFFVFGVAIGAIGASLLGIVLYARRVRRGRAKLPLLLIVCSVALWAVALFLPAVHFGTSCDPNYFDSGQMYRGRGVLALGWLSPAFPSWAGQFVVWAIALAAGGATQRRHPVVGYLGIAVGLASVAYPFTQLGHCIDATGPDTDVLEHLRSFGPGFYLGAMAMLAAIGAIALPLVSRGRAMPRSSEATAEDSALP